MGVTVTMATGGVIYGIRLRSEFDYRYVGLTTNSAHFRLRQHLEAAAGGRKTPFYDWLRKQDRNEVVVDELDWIEGLDKLGEAEISWIAHLRRDGQPLLNLSQGGLGPTGVVWTDEMREAARVRSTGRVGISRFAEENPFYGRKHSDAQRTKWSLERKGSNSGSVNPNHGKFGSLTRASVMSYRRNLVCDFPNGGGAQGTLTSGNEQAKRRAQRCQRSEGGGRCPLVSAMLSHAITRTRAPSRVRVSTASRMQPKPTTSEESDSCYA